MFETTEDCVVAACRLVALAQGAPDREDDFIQSNERAGTSYAPLGEAPRIDDVLYLGFDAAPGDVGEVIALHVWTETHTTDGETRRTLMAEHADALQQARRCGPGALAAVPDWRSHYGVTVAWEYPSAAGTWQSLPQLRDETRALTLSGFVRFAVPGDWAPDPTSSSVTHLLRCRVVSGRYECPPRLERIGLFAVEARHAVLVAAQALGVSDGTAGQRFDLTRSPVVAGSTQLEITHHDGSTETWREVPDWDRVGPHDRAFVLEPER